MIALAIPLGASAGNGPGGGGSGNSGSGSLSSGHGNGTFVSPGLLKKAKDNPGTKLRLIVESVQGADAAEKAFRGLGNGGALNRKLGIVGAVAIEIPAAKLDKLANNPGLSITPDAPVRFTSLPTSSQLWPHESGNSTNWSSDARSTNHPTIAIVDSGIDTSRADFAGRILADVKLSTLETGAAGDSRGHGTFVAGIAAGAGAKNAGAAPFAKLVSLDVMNEKGVARTSDVIAACEWILQNKQQYNIRVANFSLHSSTPSNFTNDPLDKAVEKLWFSGVVVVAASGNYGSATGPSGVKYAPGNDPFVITVGAIDIGGTMKKGDDAAAPWSAYGYTYDGFRKPEVSAAGRYMVGPVPLSSTLAAQRADKLVDAVRGYIQLSGTSFAAPVVAGTAAQILARNPTWTPDQVKGALMQTAGPVNHAAPGAAGVGQVMAAKAARASGRANPNAGLNQFLKPDPKGGSIPVFDAASWDTTAKANVSWDTVSWDSASWDNASWDVASWETVSWETVSWETVSWETVSWETASWENASYEDAVEGDTNDTGGYDAGAAPDVTADPDLELSLEELLLVAPSVLAPEPAPTAPASDTSTTTESTSTTDSTTPSVTDTSGTTTGITAPLLGS